MPEDYGFKDLDWPYISALAEELSIPTSTILLKWIAKNVVIGTAKPQEASLAVALSQSEQFILLLAMLEFKEGSSQEEIVDRYTAMLNKMIKIALTEMKDAKPSED